MKFDDEKGYVMTVVVFAFVIMSLVAVASLTNSHDERLSAHAVLRGTMERYANEADVQRAWAELEPRIDSIWPLLEGGDSLELEPGIWFYRYSNEPLFVFETLEWTGLKHSLAIRSGRVKAYFTGWPTYYVPVSPDSAPGSPDPNAWHCVLQSNCYNSPNFALDTVPAKLVGESLRYTELF